MAPPVLGVIAVMAIILASLVLLFMVQSLVAPRLFVGVLSEPRYQPCNAGKQWLLYDCKPNAITGLGCMIPGSGGKLSYKTIAVQAHTCIADPGGTVSGQRVISWVWKEYGTAGLCTSSGNTGCCNYSSSCTRTVSYICIRTPESVSVLGENQCTPEYLPVPYPQFDPDGSYDVNPITLQIPCRENYCGATADS